MQRCLVLLPLASALLAPTPAARSVAVRPSSYLDDIAAVPAAASAVTEVRRSAAERLSTAPPATEVRFLLSVGPASELTGADEKTDWRGLNMPAAASSIVKGPATSRAPQMRRRNDTIQVKLQ